MSQLIIAGYVPGPSRRSRPIATPAIVIPIPQHCIIMFIPREAPCASRMLSWTDLRQRYRPLQGARRHSRPTTRPRTDVDDQPIRTRAKDLRDLNRERELLRRRLGGGERVLGETVPGRGVKVGDRSRPDGWNRCEGRV